MGVGPREVLFAGFAAVVVAMAIVYMFPVRCKTPRTEGFEDTQVVKCPNSAQGAKAFTDKQGNLNCCMGQLNGDKCEGTVFCTFSGNNPGVTLCSDYMKRYKKNGKYTGDVPEDFIRAFSVNGGKIFKDFMEQHTFRQLKFWITQPKIQSSPLFKEINRLLEEETQFVNQNLDNYDAEYLAREFLYVDKAWGIIRNKFGIYYDSNEKAPMATVNLQKQLICKS